MSLPITTDPARRITPQSLRDTSLTFATLPPVETPQALLSVALAMEREAVMRYAELADRMEMNGDMGLAALFRGLQTEESGHEYGITAWIERANLTRRDSVRFCWDLPDEESGPPGDGGDGLNVPWRALAMALLNEERTFAFYANTAREAEDAEVRRYAESMAREELSHILLLRLQRRSAWRAERAERAELDGQPPRPEAPEIERPDDLRALACAGEATAAAALTDAAERLRQEAPDDGVTGRLLAALADEAANRADCLGTLADDVLPPADAAENDQDSPARRLLRREARRAADTFDAFMLIAESTRDDTIRRDAQAEADIALARLARLRDRLAALAGEG